jgi:hypothetical protein
LIGFVPEFEDLVEPGFRKGAGGSFVSFIALFGDAVD